MACGGLLPSSFLPRRVDSTSRHLSRVERHEASPGIDTKKVILGAFHSKVVTGSGLEGRSPRRMFRGLPAIFILAFRKASMGGMGLQGGFHLPMPLCRIDPADVAVPSKSFYHRKPSACGAGRACFSQSHNVGGQARSALHCLPVAM